jgi:hypothetical protein
MGDFIIRLRAAPGGDAIKALRAMLKAAWRCHKLKCISIEEKETQTNDKNHEHQNEKQ